MKPKEKMKINLKEVFSALFSRLDLRLVRESHYVKNMSTLSELQSLRFRETRNGFIFDFLREVSDASAVIENLNKSQSQLLQDLFVADTLKWKRNGFFVEFGATNGVDLSNTFMLEKDFGWNGILAEPGRNWHSELLKNRSASISTECVWSQNGLELEFIESEYPEFSTIKLFEDHDGMQESRNARTRYSVSTIALEDLLIKFNAPKYIDYMSIDTEGSEFEILKHFNFDKYSFGILTVEHNHSASQKTIDELLSDNGYRRVHANISQFDGWYVNESLHGR